MKPGIQTTEFWLTLLGNLAGVIGQVQGFIPAPWGMVAAGSLTAVYTAARTIVKVYSNAQQQP